jgi:peptide chain release factor 1
LRRIPLAERDSIAARLEAIDVELCQPSIQRNPPALRALTSERANLVRILQVLEGIDRNRSSIAEMREAMDSGDPDLMQIAREDLPGLENQTVLLENEIRKLLLPRDENDQRNVIVEIRSGTGGEEAALFAGNAYRMYAAYAARRGWKIEVLGSRPSELGGLKEIVFAVTGKDVYSRLKFEAGVHRVQRVPETEASGRIHTSACTVAILPEAEEVEVAIRQEDLKIDVYRSTGPGGQSVNTTDSAVRITHLPTGLVVTCQDEKSQHKNKAKAMKVLSSRLLALMREKQDSQRAEVRRSMVGSGDRSAKIRTYNFPQSRVTDHRIHLTLHSLDAVMAGDLDPIIDALISEEQNRLLSERSSVIGGDILK